MTDMEDLLAQTIADLESESGEEAQETEDGGPADDAGELPEDDLDDSGDEGEVEETDEDDAESTEEQGEEEPEDSEEDEAEAEPEPQKSQGSEIEELRAELAEARQNLSQMRDYLLAERQAAQQAGAVSAQPSPQLREAVTLLAFGGESEEAKSKLQSLPADVQREAQERIKAYSDRMVERILDPWADLREVLPYVDQRLDQREAPRREAALRERLVEYTKGLSSSADQARFLEIVRSIPGGPEAAEQKLELATRLFKAEQRNAGLAKRKQKLKTKERQLSANKRAALTSTARGRKRKGERKLQIPDGVTDLSDIYDSVRSQLSE